MIPTFLSSIAARRLSAGLAFAIAVTLRADPPTPQPIFDGRTLGGWEGNAQLWRVEDGAITGEIAAGGRLPKNEFIWWQGELHDFDLTLEFRGVRLHPVRDAEIPVLAARQPDDFENDPAAELYLFVGIVEVDDGQRDPGLATGIASLERAFARAHEQAVPLAPDPDWHAVR